jgi:hypothetical protein
MVPLVECSHFDELALLVPDMGKLAKTCVALFVELAIELNLFKCNESSSVNTCLDGVLEYLKPKLSALFSIHPEH